MEKFLFGTRRDIESIINKLIEYSKTNTTDDVSKLIRSGPFGLEIKDEEFSIPEEKYDEKIVLPEYDYKTDNRMCLELAKILIENREMMKKDEECKDRILTPTVIERVLINRKNSTINKKVFYALCDLRANMENVNLSGVYIHGLDFRGLRGLTIDLDKVKDKDLINVNFAGVTLVGSLDNAKLYYTRFGGSNPKCTLNPQTIANKSMMCTDLWGLTVDGSFDGVKIDHCSFFGVKGAAIINPQTVYGKKLEGINFYHSYILGENGSEPSFKGCIVKRCDFNGIKNKITINLDDLEYYYVNGHDDHWRDEPVKTKLYKCNLFETTITGNVLSHDLRTIMYDNSFYWLPVWPNRSATVDELKGPLEGCIIFRNDPVELTDPKIYKSEFLNVNINIIDHEDEKQETYSVEEARKRNIKKVKKKVLKKKLDDFLKQVF